MLRKLSIILWCISFMFCIYYTNNMVNIEKQKELDIIRNQISLQCNKEYIELWYKDRAIFLDSIYE